ncbi:SPOR domain-containing protein [Fulvivirga sedimenti]|uniref:SPOR domain-containing protein n=1 Tax=Fulvivirga sedimenti TaxID=2879465 RepID=A0A9X1HJJ0_9BACT|nr:SPOR domain-containing protein [Fulvivirga sedimenti]MCA6073329.1 SPOR domain-containing protein [Fulvivirga sedimenti]
MAKKDNDSEFEDLNDNTGDINEADDSFGLPDINYEPIDRSEEAEETKPAEEEAVEDQPFMYAQRPEDEPAADITPDSSEENIFGTVEENESVEEAAAEVAVSNEGEEEEKAYVPGSYTPKKSSNSNVGAIIGIILVIILAGFGIWYFLYEQPRKAEIAQQEQAEKDRIAAQQREEAARAAAERDRLAQEEAARLAEEQRLAEESQNAGDGTIETISARTGRYYVIVASAIDGDLAMDYAKKLAAEGNSVKIIQPYGKVLYHRVAVRNMETLAEAESRMDELKEAYGEGVWVMKY